MRDFDLKKEKKEDNEEIYSKVVRAGRRTYFFDVKPTRGDDYYITITESRRKQDGEGEFSFEKHKIFLYKEDFQKFADGLLGTVGFIKNSRPDLFEGEKKDYEEPVFESESVQNSIDIEFDSL